MGLRINELYFSGEAAAAASSKIERPVRGFAPPVDVEIAYSHGVTKTFKLNYDKQAVCHVDRKSGSSCRKGSKLPNENASFV